MTGKMAVLGAGAWGTALAVNQVSNGQKVTLWGRDARQIRQMDNIRESVKYLPGIKLPSALKFETDLLNAVTDATVILLVVPAQNMAEIVGNIASSILPGTALLSCAKGIEAQTGRTMSQVIEEECPHANTAALSGPSFASDVVSGLPTAVTVAAKDIGTALTLCETLSNKQLRCYASDDLLGVDYGGALKNVLAIAAGIVHGKKLGASALAAVTTRGFAELQRLAVSLSAKPETLNGLSGLGDLILTCSSEKSRNFAYGTALGCGDDLTDMKLAEGVKTASIAAKVARRNGVDAPLICAVSDLLDGKSNVEATITQLLSRPVKIENDNS